MDAINRCRGHILIGTAVSLATCIGVSAATELLFLDVSQPFYQPNGGLEIHRVTYAAFFGSPFPGQEIRHLATPNCTVQAGGQYTFLDSTSRDQNVASRLGVQVAVGVNQVFFRVELFDELLPKLLGSQVAVALA